jgi:hypothetical protein
MVSEGDPTDVGGSPNPCVLPWAELKAAPSNGWSLGANGKSVDFHGSTCDKMTSGGASTVEVLYGCPSPPSVIK